MVPIKEREKLTRFLLGYRNERNISQRFLAEILKVSYTVIQQWEKGTTFPGRSNLHAIAQLRGWSSEQMETYLKTGVEPDTPQFEVMLSQVDRLTKEQVADLHIALAKRIIQLLADQ